MISANRHRQGGVDKLWILLSIVGWVLLGASSLAAASGATSRLETFFDQWRQAAGPWMTEAEAQLFDQLEGAEARELFLRHFWAQRQPLPAATDGAAAMAAEIDPAERFQRHLEEALARFEGLEDARARALLLAGKPLDVTHLGACADVLRPLEVWTYHDATVLLFYRQGSEVRQWSPAEGAGALMFADSSRWSSQEVFDFFDDRGCWRSRHGAAIDLQAALDGALAFDALVERSVSRPRDASWPEKFKARRAAGELGLPVPHVSLETPGRFQQKTILRGRFLIPPSLVGRNAEGHLFDRLIIQGDIWLGKTPGGRLVDSFRVVHHVAGSPSDEAAFPLVFYRRLRPGTYYLDVRLQDRRGLALARRQESLVVPRLHTEAQPPAGYGKGFSGLTRSQVGVLTTFPGIEILPPTQQLLVGEVWLEAVTTGGPIDAVAFELDGREVARDPDAPYAALVDFGSQPRRRHLRAVAYDPAAMELVVDEQVLDLPSRFAVHLEEPTAQHYGDQARVRLELPADVDLDRLEIFLGDRLLATLHQPPFVQALPQLPAAAPEALRFVRAVATLESGEQVEDLVVIQGQGPLEEIDIQLLELYATVVDAQGRPVRGLERQAFRVFDDDVEQQLIRFDTVESLAINVALLMDISSSMRRQLELASRSARRFFETILTPKDRASLLTFNDDIQQVVPFTHDVDLLLRGTTGFRAWGTTRLHDSLIFTLHSFGGLEGKRALVLLSDGQDVDSDFPFPQVLEAALKSRLAVYPIVLGLEDAETLANLRTLAQETGGRFFAIANIEQLDRVYRRIEEELRSQYLLVYRSPPRSQGSGLRRLRVDLAGEGLRARTLTAYYP